MWMRHDCQCSIHTWCGSWDVWVGGTAALNGVPWKLIDDHSFYVLYNCESICCNVACILLFNTPLRHEHIVLLTTYYFPLIPQFQRSIHELFLNNQDKKINVIVIGPLTQAEEDRRTTLHELLNFLAEPYSPPETEGPENQGTSPPRERLRRTPAKSLLADDVTLIVLQPKAIENESKTSRKFCKFEPAKYVC